MTPKPTDAERELYRLGRTGEALALYALRTGNADALSAFQEDRDDRERRYARAEATSAIVKAARAWCSPVHDSNRVMRSREAALDTAVKHYETLIAGEE